MDVVHVAEDHLCVAIVLAFLEATALQPIGFGTEPRAGIVNYNPRVIYECLAIVGCLSYFI